MLDPVPDLPEALVLLGQLRLQAAHIDELKQKITALEQEQFACLRSGEEVARELDLYRHIRSESEWFFDNSLDMLGIAEVGGEIRRVNLAFGRILGYHPDELIGLQVVKLMHPDDQERAYMELKSLGTGKDSINFEVRCRHQNGQWRWISWTCPAVVSNERGLYAIGRDITEKKTNEAELLYCAQHDSLTTLFNRAAFDQALAQAIARADRSPAYEVGLLLIDLDGFKSINDRYGHAAGDVVLKTVASRLLSYQRKNEIVCRLGGDEFALIVEGSGRLSLDPLAQRIVDLVRASIPCDAGQVEVGCSIGIALYRASARDTDSIYKRADTAMYTVKSAGKNGFAYHSPSPL
ncbi:MAG: sensor domain-containing diguanylate cyclase [Pseudomonadota bacterium]